jgi:hypothetical protein
MKKLAIASLAVAILALVSVVSVRAAEVEPGFTPLQNGKDFTGWHVRKEGAHNAWKVEDGAFHNALKKGEHGVDLVTDQKFWNFTVKYDFMVPDESNSGFYLRGRHEIQVLGDHAKGQPAKNGNGSIYNFKAPDVFASKPGDVWQSAEATIIGHKITVILNGQKIHDNVECDKATGSEIDKNVNEPGPLFLQGDHGEVRFRNIRIKELPKE